MPPKARRKKPADQLPPATDWRTTDADEILKRQLSARKDKARVVNLDPAHPVFSLFAVHSPSGLTDQVELRDLAARQHACTCTDFRINGLGTCKHIEAVRRHLARREKPSLRAKLVHIAQRRPLTPKEQDKLMRIMAMMRMVCDTPRHHQNPDLRRLPQARRSSLRPRRQSYHLLRVGRHA